MACDVQTVVEQPQHYHGSALAPRGRYRRQAAVDRGFSLIELLIVMVIVAILTAVALPSYQNYILSTHRTDAKTALLDLAAREERYLSLNPAGYTSVAANLSYAAFPVTLFAGTTADYQLSVASATATSYLLQAVPQGTQTNDTCGAYTLDNLGNQLNIYPAGTPAQTIAGCW
ncbi:MAG TPA: type IV pilin protein [Burkholderiaceae bacterium]|nr:type IV pilin protein [Burkholderiaceae bacterium]